MAAPAADLDAFLAATARQVEALLDRILPDGTGADAAGTGAPAAIAEAMRYSVFAGGKRLRPAVVLASARAVGGRPEDALPAAAAVEMVHTYSLIHDDLPCMDDDDLRRGQPTSHVRFGEPLAILAGDALHAQAFEVLASAALPAAARLESLRRLAAAIGPGGMVGGQVLDLEAEERFPEARGLERIHRKKTGALFGAAAALGALAGGANRNGVDALETFGRELGLLFQIVDDLLDDEASTTALGKSAGKDRAAGKATYLAIHGRAGAHREAERRAEAAGACLGGAPVSGDGARLLAALVERVLHRES